MLVHSDVCGPSRVKNITGTRCFVTLIDDHIRICWVYLLKEKSKVERVFKEFYSMIENQFQTKIQVLRIDNGKEFFNTILGSFFKEKRIFFHQSSCIHKP